MLWTHGGVDRSWHGDELSCARPEESVFLSVPSFGTSFQAAARCGPWRKGGGGQPERTVVSLGIFLDRRSIAPTTGRNHLPAGGVQSRLGVLPDKAVTAERAGLSRG